MTSIYQLPGYLGEQTARFFNWYSRQPLTFIGTTGSIILMTQSLFHCNQNRGFFDEWGCRFATHPIPNGILCMYILVGALQKVLRNQPEPIYNRNVVWIRNPGRAGVEVNPTQIQVR